MRGLLMDREPGPSAPRAPLSTRGLHHHGHHAQQPHHRRRPSDGVETAPFHPQLGRGASATGSGHDRNANGSSSTTGHGRGVNGVGLQLSQQGQQHVLPLAPGCATAAGSNGTAHGLLAAEQVQALVRDGLAASAAVSQLHHDPGSWVNSQSRHSDPDHANTSYSDGTDTGVMPSYLDAASRSSGVASTSGGPGRSSGHSAAHTRSSTGGRSPASASARLASAAAVAAAVSSAAGAGGGASTAGRVPLELAERVAAAVAADAAPHPGPAWGTAGNGTSSPEAVGGSGARASVSRHGGSGHGNGNGSGLSPWHPEAELLPPSTLDQLPEGDERYAADDEDREDDQQQDEEDGGERPGRRQRRRRSHSDSNVGDDLLEAPRPRRPRHPSRAEHCMLRQQAAVHELALRPRAPAPEDLRLTSRLMTTTHWSQLLPLLADHAEAHERRQRQRQQQHQHQQQRSQAGGRVGASGNGSRAHSPAGRSGMNARTSGTSNTSSNGSSDDGASGNGKGAAGLNALAAAAAAAASGLVPVAALPYTAQHVAAALQRTAQLVEHGAGPASAADARRLHGLVDCLARLAAVLLPSPGMGLREITSVFHSLIRLRHPVGKPYYIAFMTAARKRFATAAATAATAAAAPAAAAPDAAVPCGADGASASAYAPAGSAAAGAAAAGTAHDLSQLVWCVATCGMSGLRADWAAAYAAALQPVVTALAPKGVAMVLYGLARLRSPPPPALLGELCAQLLRHMEAAGAALEGASVDGSEWEAVKACASRCAEEERQRVWSAQQQAQQQAAAMGSGVDSAAAYSSSSSSSGSSSSSSATSGHCRPVDVSLSLWALATLRLPPGGFCPRLLPAAERYSLAHLPDFPQQELSNLLWALARLQHRPSPAFMAGLYDTTAALLPELQPQALSTLLYSLAQMRPAGAAPPEQAWLAAAAGRAAEALPGFGPQSLALTVYALAVLGYRPQDSWLHAFHSQLEAQRSGVDTRVRDKVREAYRLMAFRPAGSSGAGAAAAAAAELQGARGGVSSSAGAAQGLRRASTAGGSSSGASPGLRAAPSRWQATAAAAAAAPVDSSRAPQPAAAAAAAARRVGRPDGRQPTAAPGAAGGAPQQGEAASAALEAADLDAAGVASQPQADDAATSAAVSVLVRPSRFGF
ncbi:hypothetical protein HYH02_009165 [Chlamydomonas schloesseri]|uniref:Uncharacterized protein n=1 Tax=Chlamydomonas schloesseri TaxID=2026947 RepID=A0A835WB93_9CHLO|nr:hypothetical protein HYH02_009165 [Chlamydomonas schloesseri]|eukprot:KAG2444228.1 hypothetical protein HYH02_009165 [Chlamydomonas schloesseri]